MLLTQLDLCSGIGAGFPVAGIVTEGFELVGLCDLIADREHEYIRDILLQRFPYVSIFHDVRERSHWQLWRGQLPSLISASPPCPPFSLEGKRLGADDPRDCIPAVTDAIAILQPKFAVIENVPGLLTCPIRSGEPPGSYFRNLLRTFDSIGYDAEWVCVSSAYFETPWIGARLLLVATSRRVVQQFNQEPTPWYEQVRGQVQAVGIAGEKSGSQSRIFRGGFRIAEELDRPIGVKSGDPVVRQRRSALGNCLDPRLAAIALHRVLYLDSLIK
ncbi:DNA cytosine methyltransferase [Chroococcidiopsis sp. CCALA 051]|uniref:DNA cytosine methyltransferase n=1 Tax=Chroococcidiopsis sp. CCALA 051 TaxID=869949 RepID=UPI001304FEC3|nr:DNA cytosine methyltransferase [Chroococcidiopsis sp. CCALA 051]